MKTDATFRFKPYSRYKDSGGEWLGKIPENWEVQHLSGFSSERVSIVSSDPYLSLPDVRPPWQAVASCEGC
jgi:hypothetical protein